MALALEQACPRPPTTSARCRWAPLVVVDTQGDRCWGEGYNRTIIDSRSHRARRRSSRCCAAPRASWKTTGCPACRRHVTLEPCVMCIGAMRCTRGLPRVLRHATTPRPGPAAACSTSGRCASSTITLQSPAACWPNPAAICCAGSSGNAAPRNPSHEHEKNTTARQACRQARAETAPGRCPGARAPAPDDPRRRRRMRPRPRSRSRASPRSPAGRPRHLPGFAVVPRVQRPAAAERAGAAGVEQRTASRPRMDRTRAG